jgi:nitroreductase
MELELSPRELLTTTRTVRKRLDLTRPVDRASLEDCLNVAFQAPNGSNQQMWNWVLVDDPNIRRAMADIYRGAMDDRIASSAQRRAAGVAEDYVIQDRQAQIAESVFYLRERMHEVPVLVVPTVNGRCENWDPFEQASRWGSLLPAIWSFMLALRTKGMGSAWTTLTLYREREMAALLGIPYDDVTQAGLFPVAYTIGIDFRPANRTASPSTIRWNHW